MNNRMNNCTIYPMDQGTAEWHGVRSVCFTASEFAPCFLESRTATQKSARRKLILKKIREEILRQGIVYEDWETAAKEKEERAMDYNLAVQRGRALEPLARQEYERITGYKVDQVGFVMHDYGGFGCSPDGIVCVPEKLWDRGFETKAHMPELHLAYLLEPDEFLDAHRFQIHGSMAVTGLDRWDLFGYCPNLPPILLEVKRDDFTERLLTGIIGMVDEKRRVTEQLMEKWEAWKQLNHERNAPHDPKLFRRSAQGHLPQPILPGSKAAIRIVGGKETHSD